VSIGDLAGSQDGLVGREQLFALGLTIGQIKRRLRVGRLREVHRGVYAVGHLALPRKARLRAAALSGGDVALSHSSAAEWWEIAALRSSSIHITCPRRIDRPRLIAHRRTLPADELETLDGVLVTSVARTVLDLAATEGRHACESALRRAEFRRLGSPVSLRILLDRYPGARGAGVARTALADKLFLAATESWLEDVFLPWLVDRGFEMPLANPTLEIAGRRLRPDCLWPGARLIVELDGKAGHGGGISFEEDRERDAELLAVGYRVMRITRRRFERSPGRVERTLRAAFAGRIVPAA
jgi:hypothetical protein